MRKFFCTSVVVVAILSFSLASCAPATTPEPTSFKAAFLFPGVINDGGFNSHGYIASEHVAEELGIEVAYSELVGFADCVRVGSDYAEAGYGFIWLHSGGFVGCALELAAQYPDVSVGVFTAGDLPDAPPNLWRHDSKVHEILYATGALAGLMTKTNTVGFIGAMEFPQYIAGLASYIEGAKDFNSDVEVLSLFTGDFNDAALGKEAAISQIEAGVDVIVTPADLAVFGIIEAAETAGEVWVIGMGSDQHRLSPSTILTTIVIDYSANITNLVKQTMDGTLGGHDVVGVPSGSAFFASFYGQLPADVEAQIDQLLDDISSGAVTVEENY